MHIKSTELSKELAAFMATKQLPVNHSCARNAVDMYTGAAKMNDWDGCHVFAMSHLQVHVAITKDLTHEKQLAVLWNCVSKMRWP